MGLRDLRGPRGLPVRAASPAQEEPKVILAHLGRAETRVLKGLLV